MKLILSGKLIDVLTPAEIGLIDEVYGEESFNGRVYDLVESIAEHSPVVLEFAK